MNSNLMTANEMIIAVGAEVDLRCESLSIRCTVKDVKHVYGKPRFPVVPAQGSGEQWVEFSRLTPVSKAVVAA